MRQNCFFAVTAAAAALAAIALPRPATAAPAAAPQPAAPPTAGSRLGTRPLGDLLARLGQTGGILVVAESALSGQRVALPPTPVTPENIEQHLTALVQTLPAGTAWTRLYLPAPPAGRAFSGDDVAAFAASQAKLFGTIMGAAAAAPPGMVEILGQRYPAAEAGDLVTRLRLRPVYLIHNPSRRTAAAPAGFLGAGAGDWLQMTPQQQEAYAQQAASQMLSATPEVRNQMMMQQGMVFRSLLQQMTPDQRQQMFQGMQQFFQSLGAQGLTPGGGGGAR